MLANYYKNLPAGFAESFCINATKKSTGIIFNVVAMLLAGVVATVTLFSKFGFSLPWDLNIGDYGSVSLALLVLCACLIVYLILHELTHGLAYKLLTKQKLRFGLTLTVAFCGLKEGFVNKKTSLIATLAPFVIHSVWMIIAIIFVPSGIWALILIGLFALHFGGCVGDLWVTCILLFKFAGTQVLVSDDGPCQRFFVYGEAVSGGETATEIKEENKEESNGD